MTALQFSKTFLPALLLTISNTLPAKEYILKPKHNIDKYNITSLINSSKASLEIKEQHKNLNLLKISIDDKIDAKDPIIKAVEFFDAEYIVPNIKLYAFTTVNDPKRAEQWALDKINAQEAWDISMGSKDIVVAVVDTGIDQKHDEFKNNIWTNVKEIAGNNKDDDNNGHIDDIHGWDFYSEDPDPTDETGAQNPGHGTHCAGIIGAECQNKIGICGIIPNVKIMPLRFLGADGSGDLFAAVKAIDYAIENGAHIISASFGANVPRSGAQPLIDAIKRAEEKNVIFVAAAGNEGRSNDTTETYPANTGLDNVISVAASNPHDEKPSWSNFGRKVNIASPGLDILSTIPGGYKLLSGTSMATPLVAGLIALMKSLNPNLSPLQARSIIQSSGDKVNIETESNRRINAKKALDAVSSQKLTLVPASYTLAPGQDIAFSAVGGTGPYQYRSLNDNVGQISADGHFQAKTEGEVVIEVSDANNQKAQSISIKVMTSAPQDETCPLDDALLCSILCLIKPDLPWCHNLPLPKN